MSEIQLDKNNHLLSYKDWTQAIGSQMAYEDGYYLNEDHWSIINLVRNIYKETKITPPMRLLIKSIKKELGDDLASSRSLYKLFPDGPVRLACKYGGLPKPKHCL